MYFTLLWGCVKFHTMFVCYFIVFVCCYLLCDCELLTLFIVFLLILNTSVSYCLDLISYCNPALIMTSSISCPVSTVNRSVNLCAYVCMYICMCVHTVKTVRCRELFKGLREA
jgi:hypothetical protein